MRDLAVLQHALVDRSGVNVAVNWALAWFLVWTLTAVGGYALGCLTGVLATRHRPRAALEGPRTAPSPSAASDLRKSWQEVPLLHEGSAPQYHGVALR